MKTIKEHKLDESNIMSNFYETKYYYNLTNLNNHINNEPLKIFKKKHKKWKEEKYILEKKVNNSYENLLKSYISMEKQL